MAKNELTPRALSRRDFLKLGGGLIVATAGAGLLASRARALLQPAAVAAAAVNGAPADAASNDVPPNVHLIGTDGWIYLPPSPAIPPYHPDSWAPAPFTTYMFGLRDVTGLSDALVQGQKGKSQTAGPILWTDEGSEYRMKLSNPGFVWRPDLVDAHTFHFHGFRNQIPFFDGSPHDSLGVPAGRSFTYFYRPQNPGTYMYHCHFEDTEHVHMGMTGVIFVRPLQDQGAGAIPPGKYAYNDGVIPGDPRSTAYDREFVILLTEVWAQMHWNNAHIQATDWTDYRPDFWLMNGRVYPDTLAPNGGGIDPTTGDLLAPPGRDELQYQQVSSLVQANAGERVLLRIVNLGFQLQSMTLPGLPLKVVGRDATLLRGRDNTDLSFQTTTVSVGAGESADVIFTAPNVATPTTYLLYNRNYSHLNNAGGTGYGGQMTEVRIFPAGTLPPQTRPNT